MLLARVVVVLRSLIPRSVRARQVHRGKSDRPAFGPPRAVKHLEPGREEDPQEPVQAVRPPGPAEEIDEDVIRDEGDPVPGLEALEAKSDRHRGLAGARWADQEDVNAVLERGPRGS